MAASGERLPPGVRRGSRRAQVGASLGFAALLVLIAIVVSSTSTRTSRIVPGGPVPGAAATAELLSGIPQRGIALGASGAPVVLVEFGDLQCPVCRDYSRSVLPGLVRRYVRSGKVQMQFEAISVIGSDSSRAARYAAAVAQQNLLWNYLQVWYENQQDENSGYVTDAYLREVARGVAGLDATRAALFANQPAAQAALASAEHFRAAHGIASTPSFLIARRGRPLQRLDYSDLTVGAFANVIDSQLSGSGG